MNIVKLLKSNRGVTLIELLVVVVILGIIAAVVVPMVMGNQQEAYANTNEQNLKIVQEAITRYQIDNPGEDAAKALVTDEGGTDVFKREASPLVADYLQEIPVIYDSEGNTTDDEATLEWDVTVGAEANNYMITITLPTGAAQ